MGRLVHTRDALGHVPQRSRAHSVCEIVLTPRLPEASRKRGRKAMSGSGWVSLVHATGFCMSGKTAALASAHALEVVLECFVGGSTFMLPCSWNASEVVFP